ncbi:helix-turn-helix domain-containing protein [Oceanihabitans sediminis]|uniref:DNA-binding protein n=1 Tax=Oceanihabitans sediminis TaxID=1812012 RepID=A0A368P584_9FLAO|nr:DNA-binding protein [Oceanihabitans sediminis]
MLRNQIITTDDLYEFKLQLFEELKKLLNKSSHIPNQQYLKSAEVMKLLKVSPGTLQNLRINGTIPYTKIGGIILYDYQEITRVLRENQYNNK